MVLPVLYSTDTTLYKPPYDIGFSSPYSYVSGTVGGGLGEHNVNLQKGLITAYGGWMGSFGSGAAVIWADQGIGINGIQILTSSSMYFYVERSAIDQHSLSKSLSFLKLVLKHTRNPKLKSQLLEIEKELLKLSQQKVKITLVPLMTNKAIYATSSTVKVKVKIYFKVDGTIRTAAGSGVPPLTGAAYAHAKLDLYIYLYNIDTGKTYRKTVTIAELTSQSYSFAPPFDGKEKTFRDETFVVTLEYYVEPGHYNIYGCAYVETDGWLGGVASAGGRFNFYNLDSDSGIWINTIEVSTG
ncbi:MAG: hypothetical protein GXO43_06315 [Crenarchaeota archaeon]|nr:hypothetical protein [Thermoproteota archaeon]